MGHISGKTLQQINQELSIEIWNVRAQLAASEQEKLAIKEQYQRQLVKVIQEHVQKIKELENSKDINIEEAEHKVFIKFLKQLRSFSIMNPLPKQGGFRYIALIGQNCGGKSSILNHILGLELEVGDDDTTQQIEKVFVDENKKLVYFDSPGLNQTITIIQAHILQAFYSIDYMFIVTSTTFKNSIRTIQVMDKINPPKLVLVRNQCDKFDTDLKMQKVKEKDRALLDQYGIARQVLYVSTKKEDNYMDNTRLRKLMKGQI